MRLFKPRNKKAMIRLRRQKSFNNVIDRLTSHKRGKTFSVDTAGLKLDPPFLKVTERFSPVRLLWVKEVGALVSYCDRKMEVEIADGQMYYVIK